MFPQTKISYQISLQKDFLEHTHQTYEQFFKLAQDLNPDTKVLDDSVILSQLQDLYFLLKKGILSVEEKESQDGKAILKLDILGFIQNEN